MEYSAHGHIDLEWKGNVLVCKPSGAINLQGAKKIHQLIEGLIKKKQCLCWARVEYFIDPNTAGTPDSYGLLMEHLNENVRRGCVFCGLVQSNSIHTYHFGTICNSIGLQWQEFETLTEALEYIHKNVKTLV